MKILVAYFSRAGENSVNGKIEIIKKGYTEIVAEKIAKYTNGELYKLEPEVPYPFDYMECVKRAREEGRVNFINKKDNLDKYDVVFIGFPNWYRSFPRIVSTFLQTYSFEGKTVIPFCTNEEGAFGIGESELNATVKNANIKPGFATRGYNAETCDAELTKWLAEVLK